MYEIIPTPKFQDDIKYYKKKKHFIHVDDDVDSIVSELEKGNLLGNSIDNLNLPQGEDTYKVRVVNTDTKVGKSNGYRVIYYVIKNDSIIFLLAIYYKKEDSRVPSKDEIKKLIQIYCL